MVLSENSAAAALNPRECHHFFRIQIDSYLGGESPIFQVPKSKSQGACSSDLLPLKPGSIESQLSSQSLLGRFIEDVDESSRRTES